MLESLLAALALALLTSPPSTSAALSQLAVFAQPLVAAATQATESQSSRIPAPPDASAIEAARTAIEARHAVAYASKGRAKLRRLAEDMRAEVPNAGPVEQYALLLEVERIALEAREGALAIEATRLRLAGWELDELAEREALLERFAERGKAARGDGVSVFLDFAFETIELALSVDSWGLAERRFEQARAMCAEDAVGVTAGDRTRLRSVMAAMDEAAAFRAALATLAETPDDPDANEVVGLYQFVVRRDASAAMAYLAKARDEKLAKVAAGDADTEANYGDMTPTITISIIRLEEWAQWGTDVLTEAGVEVWEQLGYDDARKVRAAIERSMHWSALTGVLDRKSKDRLSQEILRHHELLTGALAELDRVIARGREPFGPPTPRPEPTDQQRGAAVDAAVVWLLAHQDTSGAWRSTTFDEECSGCEGTTETNVDVGATALAMLALLAQENAPECGDVEGALERAGVWLIAQQQSDSGWIAGSVPPGTEAGAPAAKLNPSTVTYQHALATLALAEWQRARPNGVTLAACDLAVRAIMRCRNYRSAWRYERPGNGENDTSVTGLMLAALCAGREVGVEVGVEFGGFDDALAGAVNWIDEVRDEETGRVGYDDRGSQSVTLHSNTTMVREGREAMTAIGLKVYAIAGVKQHEDKLESMLDLLASALPIKELGDTKSKRRKHGPDLYYYFHGSEALTILAAAGNRDAKKVLKKWNAELEDALLDLQETEGHAAGSWPADGPWGVQGGRVYATALAALALSTEWRHLPMAQPW